MYIFVYFQRKKLYKEFFLREIKCFVYFSSSSREAVVSALTPHGGQPSANKSTSNPILEAENANKVPLASPESPSDINEDSGGGEAPACPNDMLASLQTSPESEEPSSSAASMLQAERGYTKLSSLPHGLSPTSGMSGRV